VSFCHLRWFHIVMCETQKTKRKYFWVKHLSNFLKIFRNYRVSNLITTALCIFENIWFFLKFEMILNSFCPIVTLCPSVNHIWKPHFPFLFTDLYLHLYLILFIQIRNDYRFSILYIALKVPDEFFFRSEWNSFWPYVKASRTSLRTRPASTFL
jgi:hypothetical protein